MKKILLSLMFLSIGQMCANSERAFVGLAAAVGVSVVGGVVYMAATQRQNDNRTDKALRFSIGAIGTGLACYAAEQRTWISGAGASTLSFWAVQGTNFSNPPPGYEPIEDTPRSKLIYGVGAAAFMGGQAFIVKGVWGFISKAIWRT